MKKVTKQVIVMILSIALLNNATFFVSAKEIINYEETPAIEETSEPESTIDPTTEPPVEATPTIEVTPTVEVIPTIDVETSIEPVETVEESPAVSPTPEVTEDTENEIKGNIVLSDAQKEEKQAFINSDAYKSFLDANEDIGYSNNEVVFTSKTYEEALQVANVFNASLDDLGYGYYLLTLDGTISAKEAITISLEDDNMPLLYPNYRYILEDDSESEEIAEDYGIMTFSLDDAPVIQTYEDRPNDPMLEISNNKYQWYHSVIGDYAAWGVTKGDSNIKVAVVDTGVLENHEELIGKVESYNVTTETAITNAHGTHVAGIIAAACDNGVGGSGIAPNVTIISIKAIASTGSSTSTLIRGINSAITHGADIINVSAGGYETDTLLDYLYSSALTNAQNNGIAIFASAGNDGTNIKVYPAAYDSVIAVSAVDKNNYRASFSNYGNWVDISAPGTSIYSSISNSSSSYSAMNGTSQASPVAAGVAALYMSAVGNGRDLNFDGVCDGNDVKYLISQMQKYGNNSYSKEIGKVVNAQKLLGTIIDIPSYSITINDELVTDIAQKISVSDDYETILKLEVKYPDDAYLVYTTDGTYPSSTNGIKYTADGIDLNTLPEGKNIIRAIAINGEGIISKTKTIVVTTYKTEIDHSLNMSIAGNKYLAYGKTAVYTATVTDATKGFIWTVDNTDYATINKNGVLVPKKAGIGNTVTVTATLKSDTTRYISYLVTITKAASKITLTCANRFLVIPTGSDTTQIIANVTSTSPYLLKWTSSNNKIATVDENGVVHAVSSGTVTIKATIMDGTNKYAYIKVNVKQLVTNIDFTLSHTQIAAGKRIRVLGVVTPSTSTNRTIKYSVDDDSYALGVRISSTGYLTVPTKAKDLLAVTVTARSADGNAINTINIPVMTTPAKSVTITAGSDLSTRGTTNSKGQLTLIKMFTTDYIQTSEYDYPVAIDENVIHLHATASNGADIRWISSNTKIATVDEYGVVTALKPGTVVIKALANDGSGKYASVKLSIINPIAGLAISVKGENKSTNDSISSITNITFGKKVSFIATTQNNFGIPTNKKITWSVDDNSYAKGARISSSGILSIPAASRTSLMNNDFITITATTTDGSGYEATYKVKVVDPIKSLVFPKTGTKMYDASGNEITGYSFTQSTIAKPKSSVNVVFYADYDSGRYPTVKISSSNPNVLGVKTSTLATCYLDSIITGAPHTQVFFKDAKGNLIPAYFIKAICNTTGKVKLTITQTDGSNKYSSLIITVKSTN